MSRIRSETNRRGHSAPSIPTQFEAYGRPIKENRFDVRTQRVSDWLCEPCPRVAQLTKHQGVASVKVMFVLIQAVCGMRLPDGIA